MKCCILTCPNRCVEFTVAPPFHVDMWNMLRHKMVHSRNVKGLRARGFCCWRRTWPDTSGLIHGKGRQERQLQYLFWWYKWLWYLYLFGHRCCSIKHVLIKGVIVLFLFQKKKKKAFWIYTKVVKLHNSAWKFNNSGISADIYTPTLCL